MISGAFDVIVEQCWNTAALPPGGLPLLPQRSGRPHACVHCLLRMMFQLRRLVVGSAAVVALFQLFLPSPTMSTSGGSEVYLAHVSSLGTCLSWCSAKLALASMTCIASIGRLSMYTRETRTISRYYYFGPCTAVTATTGILGDPSFHGA